jgi:flagellar hook-length control protein FliK
VFSVTPEPAANLSLQSTPSRSARAEQAPAPDSFSALIDSNADTASNDRPAAAAPDRPSPQPRADDKAAASDTRQPRDTTASSANASTVSQDAEPGAAQPATSGGVDAGTASKPKSASAKPGIVKDTVSDIVATPDTAASADPAAWPQPMAPSTATPAPVAVAIAAPVAVTDVAAAAPGNTTQPLAIAAAAIATSSSTVEASKPAVSPAQAQTAPEKPAAAVATPAATTEPAAATAMTAVKTDAVIPDMTAATTQAAVTDTAAAPVNQPAAKADAATQANPELAAAVAPVTPVAAIAPKETIKATAKATARPVESAAPIKTGIQSNADPSIASPSTDDAGKTVAPQGAVVDGKQKADGVPAEAAKAEPAKPDAQAAAAASATPHEHRALAAVQVQADSADAGQAANAVQQPQLQSATTTPAAPQLTVTPATTAAVPLSGLALQIAVTAQSGNSRFEIRLDPAELGRIDVRIDVDRHGQVTSHLTVEKPETLAMLRQDAPQLQRALDNAGFKTGDGGLQFSLRDQSSSGQHNDETGRNAQRLIISEDDSVPAAVAGRTYGRMLGSSSGVDIRV